MLPLFASCVAPEQALQGQGDEEVALDPAVDDGDVQSPYVDPDEREPTLSLEDIEEGVRAAIEGILDAQPAAILDAHDTMVAQGQGECPIDNEEFFELYGYHYLYGPCSAATGHSYDGYVYWYRYDELQSSGYLYHDLGYLYGTETFEAPDGQRFEAGGYVSVSDYNYGNNRYYSATVQGSFAWDGADFGSTWLGTDLEASYSVSAAYYPDYGNPPPKSMSITGSVGGLSGSVNAAVFEGLYIFDEALGSACSIEPAGRVSLRDAQGGWTVVSFDGPAFSGAAVFPSTCDGCGSAWYEGTLVGSVCPDIGGLTRWSQEGPW